MKVEIFRKEYKDKPWTSDSFILSEIESFLKRTPAGKFIVSQQGRVEIVKNRLSDRVSIEVIIFVEFIDERDVTAFLMMHKEL